MGQLILGANAITASGVIVTDEYVGESWSNFLWGHMQIIYENGGSLQEIEVQAPFNELDIGGAIGSDFSALWAIGNFKYPTIAHPLAETADHPATSFFREDSGRWNEISLTMDAPIGAAYDVQRSDDDVWTLLSSIHRQFADKGRDIAYSFTQNSNSYATTLLWMVGAEVSTSSVLPADVGSFPGAGRNLMLGFSAIDIDIQGTDGNDYLRTGDGSDELDFSQGGDDYMEGGKGSDSYIVNNGDRLFDSDGNGQIEFEGITLTGGTYEPEGEGCEPGNDNQSDDAREYKGSNGEVYTKSGSGLSVTYNGATLTIEHWKDGDLGITLSDEDPSDGDDCDPPPDDYASPLVLDLDGNGITLIALQNSTAFFDIDNDGVRERTGWVDANDGMLAIDRNADGRINDATELFGYGETFSSAGNSAPGSGLLQGPSDQDTRYSSGFAALADYDSDGNGLIDTADVAYSELLIWRDRNGDGISQATEMVSLADAGVASISLASTAVSVTSAGNLITDVSTWTDNSGGTRAVADVWFQFNQYDTRDDDRVQIDTEIAALPDLRGAGDVASLHVTMALDPVLRAMVTELTTMTPADLADAAALVEDILFRWVGVDNADRGDGRGRFTDARAVAVIEAFSDTPFAQYSGTSPRPYAGGAISDQFASILQFTTARLLAQTDLGQTLFPEIDYSSNQFLTLAAGTQSGVLLQRLVDAAPDDPIAALAHYQTGLRILDTVYMSFGDIAAGPGRAGWLALAQDALTAAGIDLSYQDVLTARIGSDADESFVTQTFAGNQFTDSRPVVAGGAGADDIFLGGEQQIVYWGGGQGNDRIALSPFTSLDWELEPRVELRMLGVNQADITIERSALGGSDVVIRLTTTGETLTIRDLLLGAAAPSGVIVFADGGQLDFRDLAQAVEALAATGTVADDVIRQQGAGELEGGAGNDTIFGGTGATDYHFGAGDGSDQIIDKPGEANRILFDAGITADQLQMTRTGFNFNDLLITVPGTGERILILSHFNGLPVIAELVFADGTSLFAGDIEGFLRNEGPGNDTIYGTDGNDYFYMGTGAGNDLYLGLDGQDEYVWAAGGDNDTVSDLGRDNAVDRVVLDFNFADLQITADTNGATFVDLVSGNTLHVDRTVEQYDFRDLTGLSLSDVISIVTAGGYGVTPVVGSIDADTLTGTNGADALTALAGNDVLTGQDGDDTLSGDDGDDALSGGAGDDSLDAGNGADLLQGDAGDDAINGGTGADTILGGEGDDTIATGDRDEAGFDLRYGNLVDGGTGNDQIRGGFENDTLAGGADDDTIDGDYGDDQIVGGTGNDVLLDRGGSTVFNYALGDGNDLIFVEDDGTDTLSFGAGISAADLSFDLVQVNGTPYGDYSSFTDGLWAVRATLAQGGSVTFAGDLFADVGGLTSLQFSDGSQLAVTAITTALRTAQAGNQLIVGRSINSNDTLWGGAGNDTIIGNSGGNQTIRFGFGDGQDVFEDVASSGYAASTIRLRAGVMPEDVQLSRGGVMDSDLIITLTSGETLTVRGQFGAYQSTSVGGTEGLVPTQVISSITFDSAPGATLTADAIRDAFLTNTAGNDLQLGTAANEVLANGAGNDTLRGGHGSDGYAFGYGSGNDVIGETADGIRYNPDTNEVDASPQDLSLLRETDTLTFGPGLDLSDMRFSAVGVGLADLRIEIISTGETMLLQGQLAPQSNWGFATKPLIPFGDSADDGRGPNGEVSRELWLETLAFQYGAEALFQAGIERFILNDGTILTREQIVNLISERADQGNDLLRTDDLGGTLDGGAGADTLLGGTGDDTYVLRLGTFEDVAQDAGGTDTLQFGVGIAPEAVAFSRGGTDGNDLIVEIGGNARNAMIIRNQFETATSGIENFTSADGRSINIDDIRVALLTESSSRFADSILGFESDDIIQALEGDDRIEARGGYDLVDGGGGYDTALFRGARDNYVITQDGIWTVVTDTTGLDGTTRMINVEALSFREGTAGETIALTENHAPVASAVTFGGIEDSAITLRASDLLAHASDPDGDGLRLVSVGDAIGGTVVLTPDGRVLFTPAQNLSGEASFTYTVADARGLTSTATTTVTLAARNDTPVAVDDVIAAVEDTTLTLSAAQLLGNDRDIDGDTLVITAVSASSGLVTLEAGQLITFTPAPNFAGNVVLTYLLSDGRVVVDGRVVIAVAAVNDAPVLTDLAAELRNGAELRLQVGDFLIGARDGDSVTLHLDSVSHAVGGTVTLSPENVVIFTPQAGFTGTGGFDYTVTDGDGGQTTARVVIALINDNTGPVVAQPLPDQTVAEDTTVLFTLPAGAFSDVDGDALTLTATLADGSALPTWLTFANGTFSGTPPANFNGALALRVTANDGTATAAQDFALTITAVNDGPVAIADSGYTVAAGGQLVLTAAQVLANDSDVDGDSLSVISLSNATGGTAVRQADGSILFTAGAGGLSGFDYTVSDGALTATAHVSISVQGVDPYAGYRTGTAGADLMLGATLMTNRIYGAAGNDLIFGGLLADSLAGGSGNDRLVGLSGDDRLEGNAGSDTLLGGFGADRLNGGTGQDRLIGDPGQDVFVFETGSGQDVIEDFITSSRSSGQRDVIELHVTGISSFAQLIAQATQSGSSAILNLGNGDVLKLNDVGLSQLSAQDFVFA